MSDLHTKPLPPLPLRSPQYRVSAKPPSFIPLNVNLNTDVPPKPVSPPTSSQRPRGASRVSMKPPSFIAVDVPRQNPKSNTAKSKNATTPVIKKVSKENQPPSALPKRRVEPTKGRTLPKAVKPPRSVFLQNQQVFDRIVSEYTSDLYVGSALPGPAKGAHTGKVSGLKDTTNSTRRNSMSLKSTGSRILLRTPPKDRSTTAKR